MQKDKTAGEVRENLAIHMKNTLNFLGKNTVSMIMNEHFVLFNQEERNALEECLK